MCSMKSLEGAPIGGGQEAVVSAVSDVAERSFFAMVDVCDEARFAESAAAAEDWLRASVWFEESACAGEVICHLPATLADRLFDAFSGRDAADPAPLVSEVHDLVGEFANMVCGSWLTRAANNRTFSLRRPEVAVDAALTGDPASSLCLEIDGAPCLIEICFDRIAEAAFVKVR